MAKFPMIAFSGNIVFNNRGKAYGIYRFEGQPYLLFPQERQMATVSHLEEALASYAGEGQILLLWEELQVSAESYYNRNAKDDTLLPLKKELRLHSTAVEDKISSGARLMRRYIVLELAIKGQVSNMEDLGVHMRDTVLKAFMAIKPVDVPGSLWKKAKESESELFGRLRRYGFNRICFEDLDFIVRKTALRFGSLPVPLPDRDKGLFTPAAIAAFTDGVLLNEKVNYVAVTEGEGRSHYQAYVHFADYPVQMPAQGRNIFSSLEFHFPYDTSIHFQMFSAHDAIHKVESKKRLLIGQMAEQASAGQIGDLGEEMGLSDSRRLQMKLENGKSLASVATCVALAHDDIKELNSRVSQLCSNFLQRNIRAIRPSALQFESMLSFLPGSLPSAPRVEVDPGYIAAMGPHFANELGDFKGYFMGWSGQVPVFWEPGRAARELNKTNAVLVSGSLGGGKSVVSKHMAYFTLMSGGYVLAIDPKEEYWPFKNRFADIVNVVDLTPRGGIALNPFIFSENTITAQTIANNYLVLVLNASGKESRLIAISQGLEMLFTRPIPERNMHNYIGCLLELYENAQYESISQEARQSAYLLQAMERTDIGRMVFGRENVAFFGQNQRMVVINVKEIPRPKPNQDPSKYTESERQGVALLFLVAAIARETAFGLPRSKPKAIIIDEAWVIADTSEGERMMDELIRVGRTYNLIPIMISQNISDLDKPVFVNNSSQVFCFRAYSGDEARIALTILGADEEAVRPATFAGLKSGLCLYRDCENRVGWLQVDVQPQSMMDEVYDTKPDADLNIGNAAVG